MPVTSLGSPVALGATAEVLAWGDEQLLKLFYRGFSRQTVEREARVTAAVRAAGLSVPAVGPVVEVAGRWGIVLERVKGRSMLSHIVSRPWRLYGYAHLLAKLQADMHGIGAVEGLPDQHTELGQKIRRATLLPGGLREATLQLLGELPTGDRLCQGDFHPDNVMLTDSGPVIIDWIDATNGNPLSDVARSSLLMVGGPMPHGQPGRAVLASIRRLFHTAYRRHYFRLRRVEPEGLGRWMVVNAAARLSEGVPEKQALLCYVQNHLQD